MCGVLHDTECVMGGVLHDTFLQYICIYVAPWSCEARHLVPLYVHTCSGMTIKLNLNLNLNVEFQ